VNYLTSPRNPDGTDRVVKPEVMPGNRPATVRRLIDSLEERFKHTYTSGVISFAPEDRTTPQLEREIMQSFEKIAFAGLRRDQYAILWVKHQHAGRTELHFLVPRVELSTGKSMNIAPPGWEALFNPFRETYNALLGWASPDDPARARDVSLPDRIATLRAQSERQGQPFTLGSRKAEDRERLRMEITEYVRREVDDGHIQDRDGVIAWLGRQGFTIGRQGKDYISVTEPQTGLRVRLKGGLYHRDRFNPRDRAERTIRYGVPDPERAMVHWAEVEALAEKRAAYHRQRYGGTENARTQDRTDEILERMIQEEARRQERRENESAAGMMPWEHGMDPDQRSLGDGLH
jgi:hypothetical protein